MYPGFKIGLLLRGGSSQLYPAPFIQLHDNSYREYRTFACMCVCVLTSSSHGPPGMSCLDLHLDSLAFSSLASFTPHCVWKVRHEV